VSNGFSFITANTTATAIVNYTGATSGKQIVVLCGDAYTTMASGTYLNLESPFSCSPGVVINLVLSGTVWFEVGRNTSAASAVSVSDTFSRAGPGMGSNWTVNQGSLQIVSNTVEGATVTVANIESWNSAVNAFTGQEFAQLTLATIGTNIGGPVVMASAAGAASGYACLESSGTTVYLIKYVAGTPTTLASGTFLAGATGDIMRLEAVPNTGLTQTVLTCYRNSSVILTWTDSSSPFTSGQPGIEITSNSATPAVTNWSGGQFTVPGGSGAQWNGGSVANAIHGPNFNNYLYLDGTVYAQNCAGLQSAINAAGAIPGVGGTTLWIPPVSIPCTSTVTFPVGSQVMLRGSGPTSQIVNNVGTDALLMAKGTLGASSTTTASYASGAFTVNVANGATFTAGKWVEIASVVGDPSYYACPNVAPAGSGGQCNSELKVISSIAGNTLKFDDSLENSYASGATVTLLTPAVVQLKDLSIVNVGMSFPAIKLWYCINCKVENVEISGGLWVNATTPAIQVGLYHSKYCTINDNLLGQFDGLLQGGTQSAALVIAGASSHNIISRNHIFKIVENAIVESSHHNIVTENDIEGCVDDCFNTHGDGNFANIFSNNVISGIGPNVTVNGLGLYISAGPPGRTGFPDRDNVITGNTISNFGNEGIGVFSTGSPGAGVANNIISNNVVRNGLTPSGDGIVVEYCAGCSVTGNTVTDMATNGIAYVIEQNNPLTFTGNQGNQTNSATGTYGFFGATNTYATITGNIMRNFAAYNWYFVNTNQATLFANNIGFAAGVGNYSYDATTNSSFSRWNNLGDTFYANSYGDSPMHSTFFGTANTAFGSAATISVNNFQKSIKVLNMSIIANGASPVCSVYPTYQVTDGTTTTTSLALNANYVTTNFSPVVFPANDPISIRQNTAATCTTYPTFLDVNVEYAETGQ
jgi:hypothetical protein